LITIFKLKTHGQAKRKMITVKGKKKTASKAGKTEKSSTLSVAAVNEKNPDNGDHNRGILSSVWRSLSRSCWVIEDTHDNTA
jgi:hypothetical protein